MASLVKIFGESGAEEIRIPLRMSPALWRHTYLRLQLRTSFRNRPVQSHIDNCDLQGIYYS